VLEQFTRCTRLEKPDVVGLIEVDTGSVRTGMLNPASCIAGALGHYTAHQCTYGTSSINQFVPIVRRQGNALVAARAARRALDQPLKPRLLAGAQVDAIVAAQGLAGVDFAGDSFHTVLTPPSLASSRCQSRGGACNGYCLPADSGRPVRRHAPTGPGHLAPGRQAVSVMYWLSGLLALFLFGYLLYALIRAETF
jgi:K+-transporting ATPase KdpF subunit